MAVGQDQNLINPGASFTSAFQGGMQMALRQKELAQQKELSMAQMAQQRSEFDVTSQLQQQQLALTKQKTMADLSMIGTHQQLAGIQIQQQQFQLDQVRNQAPNNAAIAQWQQSPESQNPTSLQQFDQSLGSLRASLPNAQSMTDLQWNQTAEGLRHQFLQTSIGQNLSAAHTSQLQTLNEAIPVLGPDGLRKFMVNPQGDPTNPSTYNMPALAQATLQNQTDRSIAHAQALSDIQVKAKTQEIGDQGQQRLDYANTLISGRSATQWERTMGQQAKAANDNLTKLKLGGATASELVPAQAEAAKWNQILETYQQANGGGNTNGSMQNPGETNSSNPGTEYIQKNWGQ